MMVLGGAAIVDEGIAPRDLREAERLASAEAGATGAGVAAAGALGLAPAAPVCCEYRHDGVRVRDGKALRGRVWSNDSEAEREMRSSGG